MDERLNHARGLLQQGQLHVAIAIYRECLESNPSSADLWNELGHALQLSGQLHAAIAAFRRAVELAPHFVAAINNLASALKSNSEYAAAIACYRDALRWKPDEPILYFNLGNAYQAAGQYAEAEQAYLLALQRRPAFAEAQHNLADCYYAAGEFEKSEVAYRLAIALRPTYVTAHSNLGNVLADQGRFREAEAAHRRAIELQPDFAELHNNLGVAYKRSGRLTEAAAAFQMALRLQPDHIESLYNLGSVWSELGESTFAQEVLGRVIAICPRHGLALSGLLHQLQLVADWDSQEPVIEALRDLIDHQATEKRTDLVSPLNCIGLPHPTTAQQQLDCARSWTAAHFPRQPTLHRIPSDPTLLGTGKRLRVGYLSADFREHPVAFQIAELLELHDRERFHIHAYSLRRSDGDPTQQRIERGVDVFRDLTSHSFRQAAATIVEDRIDILIDLQGHTAGARTEILAYRPAPLQVNYLGYPGTMGADFIDYVLADDYVLPFDQQPHYSEKIVHLPGCFMVSDQQRTMGLPSTSRGDFELPSDAFVFCAFSMHYKTSRAMFDRWLALLKAVPRSVLWLREWNAEGDAALRRRGIEAGVDVERLVFASKVPMPVHLARHRLADLYLDTYPYNQHSTACDALRVGLPLVTRSGDTFASRVAGSLLRAVGLETLIARSDEEYFEIAVSLARSPDRLHDIRRRLASSLAAHRLDDTPTMARHIERAYGEMWRRYHLGREPTPFAVGEGET